MAKKRVKQGTSKAQAAARRALFIEAMLVNGGNQTKAAIAAGFPVKSAHVRGAELVKDRKVAAELKRRTEEALAKAKATSDEVLIHMTAAMRFDPRKLANADGTLKALHELDDDTARAIEAIEVDAIQAMGEDGKPKYRLIAGVKAKGAKTAAREQLAKHFGLYEKDNRQRVDPVTELLAELAKRDTRPPVRS